jgi:hypothetical protein
MACRRSRAAWSCAYRRRPGRAPTLSHAKHAERGRFWASRLTCGVACCACRVCVEVSTCMLGVVHVHSLVKACTAHDTYTRAHS